MKKKILFVMNNLSCGGAEKALVSLLEAMDYSMYDVDLFLFKHEGLFFSKIPNQVNLLEEPLEYKYYDMSIKKAILDCLKRGRLDIALFRVCAGYIFKNEKNSVRCEQRVWRFISKSLKSIDKKYDIAVGYLEKNPIYFCVDKVDAKKKIGFIHTDYDKLGMDPDIDEKYFRKLDHIVTVSKECVNILKDRFPMYNNKIELMYNIVSPLIIQKMSLENIDIKNDGITIVSVGRLHHIKGFEMAIDACEMLVRNGYKIKWYVVGEGDEKKALEQKIIDKNLKEVFILAGVKENPYPYIRQCDIYVQTSLFEGRCLTITEAKILNKPIVSTNFNAVYEQLDNERNGLIVNKNPRSIYEGIRTLIDDIELRNHIIYNLSNEELGTELEIEKLYELFN